MHRFRVWAPRARRVELVAGGRRRRMDHESDGWWQADDADAGPGTRYAFSLDGGEARPDPRSASQPDGVLGLSAVVDQGEHRWRDGDWQRPALDRFVIYELHVGTFSPRGTFAGAIEKLPHLVELGVTAVEVMPVAEFSGDHGWGYDGADLYAPHHAYGGPDGFKELVDACHRAGLAVVLDVVYNHLGPVGNFLAEFGPYFSAAHYTLWGAALNFDGAGSEEVRRFVVDNALMWIRDYHLDGLRLDAVHAIVDESPVHILEQLSAAVDGSALLIAESDMNEPLLVRPRAAGGYGLDATWADDWHHSVFTALTGERAGYYADFDSLAKTAKALRQGWVFDGEWSAYRRRTRGHKPAGLAPRCFVVATQNHDQVGNRAKGERLCALVDAGRARAAAALLLTSPFTPLLFQGEEWAASSPFQYFTDHRDPELARRVSEGRRKEFASFGWEGELPDPQDVATFARSKLRWEERDEPSHREMLDWYRSLLALRRRLPPPSGGVGQGVDVAVNETDRRITFAREGVRVLVNLGTEEWSVVVAPTERVALSSNTSVGGDAVELSPSGVAVLESLTSNASMAPAAEITLKTRNVS